MTKKSIIEEDKLDALLIWEATTRDTIDVKRVYIDICEDIVTGVFLSQIMYWNTPDHKGFKNTKTRITFAGKNWIACKRSEWWDQCRLSLRQLDKAISVLTEKNIIETTVRKFKGTPQLHIHLNKKLLYILIQQYLNEKDKKEPKKYKSYRSRDDVSERNIGKKKLQSTVDEVLSPPTNKSDSPYQGETVSPYQGETDSPYQGETFNIDYSIDYKEKGSTVEEGFALEDLAEPRREEKIIEDSTSEVCTIEELGALATLRKNLSGGNIPKFIKNIFSKYPKENIYKVMKEIQTGLDEGTLEYCTPQYIINALDREEEDMPEIVMTDLKKYCHDKFGESDYMEVAKFYTNTLKSSFDQKASKNSKGLSLTERRKSNIDHLLKEKGRGTFMKAMRRYIELFESGRLAYEPSIERFSKFVENFDKNKFNQPAIIDVPKVPAAIVIPKPHKRYELEEMNDPSIPESEAGNWSYKCECNNIIEIYLDKECKKCKAKLNWKELDYTFFIREELA